MDTKEFFLKDAEIISKDLQTKIEKTELHAIKKKAEIDETIENLKKRKISFDADLEKLKATPDDKFDVEMEAFKKNYRTDSFIDDLDVKVTQFAEKTKSFFSDLGDKVSGFYNKHVDKKDKPEQL